MKHTKKLVSLLLTFVMVMSLTNSFVAKAATTITVTLRVEQDDASVITPVTVTLTEEDQKDFGIGLPTDKLTPLHALAKYFTEKKGATDETLSKYIIASRSEYGLYLTGISADGNSSGNPSTNAQSDVYWSYTVNNVYASVSMDSYELKDKDSVVIYGLWSPWPAEEETLYTSFDKVVYEAETNQTVTVTLTGYGAKYDENFNSVPFSKAIEGATVMAAEYNETTTSVVSGSAIQVATTDAKGNASFTFKEAKSYVLSAYKKAKDGSHYVISRPYALVHVSKPNYVTDCPTINDGTPNTSVAKKPAKVKKVKARVKKSKKTKKTIIISWKKVKNATGYRVYISKKQKKNFKKVATTKKTKVTLKRKKGTYFIKVRAYKKNGTKNLFGSYSKVIKLKVK